MLDFSKNSEVPAVHFPYTDWSSFSHYFSASTTQAFLKKNYERLQIENSDQKSFENCYPFLYYLEHAQVYYDQAEKSPLMIQPILLFYGFVHLTKACILTTDPNYPESTAVLAHGVSTRKRKRQNYNFFQDEVKFQRSGLFPLMSEKMFHMKQTDGDKATMGDLLKQLPELEDLFLHLEGKGPFIKVPQNEGEFHIPKKVLDSFHMTESRFQEFYRSKSAIPVSFCESEADYLKLKYEGERGEETAPLRYSLKKECFLLSLEKGSLFNFPELLVHYLLLYNLSMIARYETEWWSELIKMMPNKDYPFIQSFLGVTMSKTPFLVYQFLNSRK